MLRQCTKDFLSKYNFVIMIIPKLLILFAPLILVEAQFFRRYPIRRPIFRPDFSPEPNVPSVISTPTTTEKLKEDIRDVTLTSNLATTDIEATTKLPKLATSPVYKEPIKKNKITIVYPENYVPSSTIPPRPIYSEPRQPIRRPFRPRPIGRPVFGRPSTIIPSTEVYPNTLRPRFPPYMSTKHTYTTPLPELSTESQLANEIATERKPSYTAPELSSTPQPNESTIIDSNKIPIEASPSIVSSLPPNTDENLPSSVDAIRPSSTSQPDTGVVAVPNEVSTIQPDIGDVLVQNKIPAMQPDIGDVLVPNKISTMQPNTGDVVVPNEVSTIQPDTGDVIVPNEVSTIQTDTGDVVVPNEVSTIQPDSGDVVVPNEVSTIQTDTGDVEVPNEVSIIQPDTGDVVVPNEVSTIQPDTEDVAVPNEVSTIQPDTEDVAVPTEVSTIKPDTGDVVVPNELSAIQPDTGDVVVPTEVSTIQPDTGDVVLFTSVPLSIITTRKPITRPVQPKPTTYYDVNQLQDYNCRVENGYDSVPNQCDVFVECKNNKAFQYSCPDGLHFDPAAKWPEFPCAYPSEVKCQSHSVLQAAKPTGECPRRYGFFPSPAGDCSQYISCQEGVATKMNCPSGLAFNIVTTSCDWPVNVPGCNPYVFGGFTCPAVPVDKFGKTSDRIFKYRYKNSCKNYIACQEGHPRLLSCDAGFSFDRTSRNCVISELVVDCKN